MRSGTWSGGLFTWKYERICFGSKVILIERSSTSHDQNYWSGNNLLNHGEARGGGLLVATKDSSQIIPSTSSSSSSSSKFLVGQMPICLKGYDTPGGGLMRVAFFHGFQ